jgi:hypothetical protein
MKMKSRPIPTQADLKVFFSYVDGSLIWNKRSSANFNTSFAGKPAGCLKKNQGYMYINLMQTQYLAHRLVYAWHYGNDLGDNQIDHIDGDKCNNRIENLRLATEVENGQNRGKQKNNTTGFKGVTYSKHDKKYQAQIHSKGKTIFLGYYETPELASAAYVSAANNRHNRFAHHSVKAMGRKE